MTRWPSNESSNDLDLSLESQQKPYRATRVGVSFIYFISSVDTDMLDEHACLGGVRAELGAIPIAETQHGLNTRLNSLDLSNLTTQGHYTEQNHVN